jgi:hypothetical protein
MPSHKYQQEESIYNLIPKPPVVQPKAPKYILFKLKIKIFSVKLLFHLIF